MKLAELWKLAGITKSRVVTDERGECVVKKRGVTLFDAVAEVVTKIGGKPGSSCPNYAEITNLLDGEETTVYINAK